MWWGGGDGGRGRGRGVWWRWLVVVEVLGRRGWWDGGVSVARKGQAG